jgi:cellulose synthase/poly-beta-1,6-N-acetylglucosamine synthase-like glycosyltransferase
VTTLCVIVPCRNEALVVGRKLANFARCEWPAAHGRHRVLVVDDGSDDETRSVARDAAERWRESFERSNVDVEVLENEIRPGKTGAIEQGLRACGGGADLFVLSDADVVLAPDALTELARPFERDARVGMVCGGQRMVAALAADGTLTAPDGRALGGKTTVYDALTALVRRAESALGIVFSVHGQLMAWRASLELHPTRGFAADDLDLMLQARCKGARIAIAPRALFFEARPSDAADREVQAARRARAYLQFLAHPRRGELAAAGGALARMQAALYLNLPATCAAVLVACFAAYLATWLWPLPAALAWGVRIASLAVSLPLALAVRRTFGSAGRAARASDRPLRDRWETARK